MYLFIVKLPPGIHDKEIHQYRLNLKENHASKTRLKRLPSTQKNVGIFRYVFHIFIYMLNDFRRCCCHTV